MGIREAILHEVEEKGREEGSEAKERQVIRRARERGMSVADIADLLGITVEKVEAVLAEADLEKDKP